MAASLVATSGCVVPVRFAATGLPVGTFAMDADQCHSATVAFEGHDYVGLELTSAQNPGTMVFLGRQRGGPTILPTGGNRLATVWHVVGGEAPPVVYIPESDCEVFRFSMDTSPRLGGAVAADFEVRCEWSEGRSFVAKGRFTEMCL